MAVILDASQLSDEIDRAVRGLVRVALVRDDQEQPSPVDWQRNGDGVRCGKVALVGERERVVGRGPEMNAPVNLGISVGYSEHQVHRAGTLHVDHLALNRAAGRERRGVGDDRLEHNL